MKDFPYCTIVSRIDKTKRKSIIITSITQDEENELDKNHSITIIRGKKKFNINPNDIECYGIIDFHSGSEDMDTIADFNWLDHLSFCGIWVPANYDYEEHCAYSTIKVPKWYDTTRPEIVAQYCHGIIGKPERCVIFKSYSK